MRYEKKLSKAHLEVTRIDPKYFATDLRQT